jgi:DNA-binding response OmpR family regulator
MHAVVMSDDGDFHRLAALIAPCGVSLDVISPADHPPVCALAVLDRQPATADTVARVQTLRAGGARVVVLVERAAQAHVADLYRSGADVVFEADVDPYHLFLQCCALLNVWQPETRGARVGRGTFDAGTRRILVDDRAVRLTEAESKILGMLVDARSGYIGRDSISELVFRIPYDRFDRRIDVHVSNLRKKLRENDVGAVIDTSRLNGFRLLSTLTETAIAASA